MARREVTIVLIWFSIICMYSSQKLINQNLVVSETTATTLEELKDELNAEQEAQLEGGLIVAVEGDLNKKDWMQTFGGIKGKQQNSADMKPPKRYNKVKRIPVLNYDEITQNKILGEKEIEERRNKAIKEAMDALEKDSCLKFVQRMTEKNYIKFERSDIGCVSNLGTKPGAQSISLSPSCLYKGTVMHQIMHSLGFLHEHTRMDRDLYIQIQMKNVKQSFAKNFDKYEHLISDDTVNEYDYYSLMHPPLDFFSASGNPTLLIKNNTIDKSRVGQREGLSEIDIKKLNEAFNCEAKAAFDDEKKESTTEDDDTLTEDDFDLVPKRERKKNKENIKKEDEKKKTLKKEDLKKEDLNLTNILKKGKGKSKRKESTDKDNKSKKVNSKRKKKASKEKENSI